jgi:hypothetical protein
MLHPIALVVMGFGAILALVGIVLFSKRGAEGTSSLKVLGFEFQLGGSSLVIFVMGVLLVMLPFIKKDDFPALMTPTQDKATIPKDVQKPILSDAKVFRDRLKNGVRVQRWS